MDVDVIELEAVLPHAYYDPTGRIRIEHAPGDRFTVADSHGMTARQLAAALVAAGWAKPAARRVAAKRTS